MDAVSNPRLMRCNLLQIPIEYGMAQSMSEAAGQTRAEIKAAMTPHGARVFSAVLVDETRNPRDARIGLWRRPIQKTKKPAVKRALMCSAIRSSGTC
ncbi:hypothetical protein, partial [Burkholderia pyrrocinia]|uniref:hypothetical protein n=1 Tax=Burkholderia pyrrocinia TaxID=60550 RepID=UPI001A9FDB20